VSETVIELTIDSEKKHSVVYRSDEAQMTVYVPKTVLMRLVSGTWPAAIEMGLRVLRP
jgi:hypothetical protein